MKFFEEEIYVANSSTCNCDEQGCQNGCQSCDNCDNSWKD